MMKDLWLVIKSACDFGKCILIWSYLCCLVLWMDQELYRVQKDHEESSMCHTYTSEFELSVARPAKVSASSSRAVPLGTCSNGKWLKVVETMSVPSGGLIGDTLGIRIIIPWLIRSSVILKSEFIICSIKLRCNEVLTEGRSLYTDEGTSWARYLARMHKDRRPQLFPVFLNPQRVITSINPLNNQSHSKVYEYNGSLQRLFRSSGSVTQRRSLLSLP